MIQNKSEWNRTRSDFAGICPRRWHRELLAARHCNLLIISSPFLPPCTFLSHCLVQLVIIPSGQLCPHANLMSPPQIEVLFCLRDQLSFSSLSKFRIYCQSSSETRGKTLTCGASQLKYLLLHVLNSTHNLQSKEKKSMISITIRVKLKLGSADGASGEESSYDVWSQWTGVKWNIAKTKWGSAGCTGDVGWKRRERSKQQLTKGGEGDSTPDINNIP